MDEEIYLQNPYLEELKGEVIEKKKKGNEYHIVLNRTIFYPRQTDAINIDSGTINGVKVLDVFKDRGKIKHIVKENISNKDVTMKIDWNIRFDFMQQHTGKHILASSIETLYGVNISGFKLDNQYAYIDIDYSGLNNSDINRIETFANHMIYNDFKIKNKVEQVDGKNRRIIFIDNMSSAACDGIHCSSTGEVGIIKVIDFNENEENNITVKFVCGNRALKDYNSKDVILRQTAEMLCCKETELYKKVEELLIENDKLKNAKVSDTE